MAQKFTQLMVVTGLKAWWDQQNKVYYLQFTIFNKPAKPIKFVWFNNIN